MVKFKFFKSINCSRLETQTIPEEIVRENKFSTGKGGEGKYRILNGCGLTLKLHQFLQ